MSQTAPMARPFTVTLMVLLFWIQAILTAIGGIWLLVSADNATIAEQFSDDAASANAIGWTLIVFGVLLALLAIGLSRGSRVIRMLITIVLVLRLVWDIYLIVFTNYDAAAFVSIIINFILLWLLWNSKANAFFNQR